MHPPHLPPKTDPALSNHRWRRLKLLLAAAFFGLVAGISGASMMIGWIWPRYADGDTWVTASSRSGLTRLQLEDRVREEVTERLAAVYAEEGNASGISFIEKKIGDAVMLSSDGWLALWQPTYNGTGKELRVLTHDGVVLKPERALIDRLAGIVYLKVKGNFKVVSFANSESTLALDEVYVFERGAWRHSFIYNVTGRAREVPHLDTAPMLAYMLAGDFAPGSIVINRQGRIVGFVGSSRAVVPARAMVEMLPTILSKKQVFYPSLGVEGWFSMERPIVINGESIHGFAVVKVLAASSNVRKGDIIVEINGRVVNAENVWYSITTHQTVQVTVLRNGKKITLPVTVTTITPSL